MRPAGRLNVVRDGGSLISISATDGIVIASGANVDIESGNTVDIKGSTVNIDAAGGTDPTINMTAGTMNLSSNSQMNITSANGIDVTGAGNITVSSGGSFRAENSTSQSYVEVDNDGVDIVGSNINLSTNGLITLCNGNTINNQGVISLHNGDMIIDGANGTITTTANADIIAGGDINLNAATSKLNATAGEVNISGTAALNATGGAVNITSGSTLDIDSDNFKVVSSTGAVEVNGTIYAQAGKIGCDSSKSGGWDITENRLTSGAGSYNVTLSSDNTIIPSSIGEWDTATTYATGDIVKVTTSGVSRYYKATAASTGKKPGTTGGSAYWEEAEEWFAIWAGGTKAVDAPFRVTRDGSVFLNSLWTVNPNDPSGTAKKIDLSAAVWKLTYSTIMSNEKDSGGTYTKKITLSDSTATRDKEILFNNVSSYVESDNYCTSITLSDGKILNFNTASGIKDYIFTGTGTLEHGIQFNVSGVKANKTVIPGTTHGPYDLTLIGSGTSAALNATFTATASTSDSNFVYTTVNAYPWAVINRSNDNFTINSQIRSEADGGGEAWSGRNIKTLVLGVDLPSPSGTPPTSINIRGKLTYDGSDKYSTGINIYPDYMLGKDNDDLRITSYIKSGSTVHSAIQETKTVTASLALAGSTLTPSAAIQDVTGTFAGTSKTVTVSRTINTTAHTVTPTATIGDLGTINGTADTVSATSVGSGSSAAAYAVFTGTALYAGNNMASATVNAYPWAIISNESDKLRVTAQVRSAASGGGSAWAGITVNDYDVTPAATITSATGGATITPTATIGSLSYTGTNITATVSETHDIDTDNKYIGIQPTVTIDGTAYNGAYKTISFTANLTTSTSAGVTTYGANCVIGGKTYTSPTTVSYKTESKMSNQTYYKFNAFKPGTMRQAGSLDPSEYVYVVYEGETHVSYTADTLSGYTEQVFYYVDSSGTQYYTKQ